MVPVFGSGGSSGEGGFSVLEYCSTGTVPVSVPEKRFRRFQFSLRFLRDHKRTGMAKVQTNIRTNNLRAPHMKMWGFETKRARKFTRYLPRTLPWNFIGILAPTPTCCSHEKDEFRPMWPKLGDPLISWRAWLFLGRKFRGNSTFRLFWGVVWVVF